MSRITVERYWEETEPPWDRGDVPWIVRMAVRWGITLVGFLAAEWFVNDVVYDRDRFIVDGTEALLIAAAIFVGLRAVLRPILLFLTCPLQLITFGLFILVINAGGPPPGDFLDLTPADWEIGVRATIMSTLYLCYAVIPHMVERGRGCIICNQSYAVKHPLARLITANSLRMAVIGMMKSLANELGPKGIRVNTVNPAWTWTDRVKQLMTDRAKANQTTVEAESAAVVQGLPLKRMGTVEEYGKTIAWLASPAAGFIHGHNLMFDGGGTATAL